MGDSSRSPGAAQRTASPEGSEALYHLDSDPRELTDLSGSREAWGALEELRKLEARVAHRNRARAAALNRAAGE